MNQPWFCWCCYAQDKEQKDRLRNTLTRKAAARDAGGVSTLVLALQRSFGKKWEECYVYLLNQSWHWICTTGQTCQNYGPGDNFPFMLIYWCWVSTKYIAKYISSIGGYDHTVYIYPHLVLFLKHIRKYFQCLTSKNQRAVFHLCLFFFFCFCRG